MFMYFPGLGDISSRADRLCLALCSVFVPGGIQWTLFDARNQDSVSDIKDEPLNHCSISLAFCLNLKQVPKII